ncbi:MAG: endopeptidase La [Clostridia bacterium]|nr:endopeptidase La [Clostridia bacterium]
MTAAVGGEQNVRTLPVFVLRGRVMLPNISSQFDVGRTMSLLAVRKAVTDNSELFVVTQKNSLDETPTPDRFYSVGVICRMVKINNITDKSIRIQLSGVSRARIKDVNLVDGYYEATVEDLPFSENAPVESRAYFSFLREKFKDYVKANRNFPKDLSDALSGLEDVNEFVNILTFNLNIDEAKKQEILELSVTTERVESLSRILSSLNDNVELERKISERVKASVDKGQKEYYLRERLKAIHEELGDDSAETENLRAQILEKHMPAEDEEKVLKELDRMSRMNSSSPDYTVLRTYIDWILDLPFNKASEDRKNLNEAVDILNEDHFGLEKVKERIVEYLAVMKLTGKVGGSIICLVGPPGVGKTSVATSIARALDRRFTRMSLGGVKDEAEIRGHRKTYIGAMPGRIIYGLKDAKVNNPVFLLDEIDKLSSDLRGDPASALLEVLDPEQNKTFRDRYIEIPFDLSNVLFITTANSLETIPTPLLDRMEVISLDGYTIEEKVEIATRYLIPKRMKLNGLPDDKVEFTEGAIEKVVKGYTLEAGVRNLERKLDEIIRKIATKLARSGRLKKQKITEANVSEYLGTERFGESDRLKNDEVGAANGLAWTQYGGTTLTIEVVKIKGGKGNVQLTGKLGDVMKESALATLSFIKAHAEVFGIDLETFADVDLHVHVPEGATPKDGPSAGITLATAMLSCLTGRKVRSDIAMTGEITLRGKVLPIGGLKEKSLAAYRKGITELIIPAENVKDIEDIPENVRKELKFHPVKEAWEVFELALRK